MRIGASAGLVGPDGESTDARGRCERLASARAIELAADEAVAARDDPVADERHEVDVAGVAGLEADGGARGDVEPLPVGGEAIESESAVRFSEVVMRPDLDRPITGVRDRDAGHRPSRIQLDVAGRVEIAADRPGTAHGMGS